MYIYSYNQKSKGMKKLKEALAATLIKHTNSKFIGSMNKTVINWGSSVVPDSVMRCKILNHPVFVQEMINKILFFKRMALKGPDEPAESGISFTIPYTLAKEEALQWASEGNRVVCRTIIGGHSGKGIVLATIPEEVVDASLYTKYIGKTNEYRIHLGSQGADVILIQRKARKLDHPNPNWQIRTHDNGFIFAKNEDSPVPVEVLMVARWALVRSGLNFGAVDVLWNDSKQRAYVIEINTAPGLEGSTVQDYENYFRTYDNL